MVEIEDKIVSEELFDEYFACDLRRCGGECCIEGDAGAPLDLGEIDAIEDELDNIRPFMSPQGIAAVEANGVFEVDSDGDYTTALIDGGECAFVVREEGIALCAIEKAWRAGKCGFMKPISCHLYPIRVKEFRNGTVGLNYHRWDVCRGAACHGKKTGTKVYQCAREAIERAFGKRFYEYLCDVDSLLASGELHEE